MEWPEITDINKLPGVGVELSVTEKVDCEADVPLTPAYWTRVGALPLPPQEPFEAAIARPLASKVTFAHVYAPAATPELESVVASVPEVVMSPVRLPGVIEVGPENWGKLPATGEPAGDTAASIQSTVAAKFCITFAASATCPLEIWLGSKQAALAPTPLARPATKGRNQVEWSGDSSS